MNNTLTTTNIGKSELKSLRSLAKKHNLKQVDFINYAIAYFKKTGINPADEIYSPREEINKLSKRMDQLVRFVKTQEEKKLNPLLDELILISRKLNDQMENQVTAEHFNKLHKLLEITFNYTKNGQDRNEGQFEKLISSTHNLPNHLSSTHQMLLMMKELHEALYESIKNRSKLGSFQYEDVERFNQLIERFNSKTKD